MKRSLRLICLMLCLAMLLSMVAACGQQPQSDPTETDVPETTVPAVVEEYTEPIPDGYNQVVFYWNNPEGTYENCDMWIWQPNKDGKGHLFTECEYGGKVIINVPEGVEEIGFIVRRDCSEPGGSSWGSATKDYESDRFAKIEGKETVIYLQSGDPAQYKSNDGGKTLLQTKKINMVTMSDERAITYKITPKTTVTDVKQVKVFKNGQEVAVTSVSALGQESASGIIELAEELDLSGEYRVSIEGYGEQTVLPIDIFDSEYFAENYHYDGSDLGAVISGDTTTFKVWAPTASKVVLNLFDNGTDGAAYKSVDMVPGEKGVWSHTEECGHGTYYTYTVTTAVGTQEAVDPYA